MLKLRTIVPLALLFTLIIASCKDQPASPADAQGSSPSPAMLSGPGNAIVICSSCAYPGMPREGHLVLMDSRTGQIWAYSDDAVVGRTAPTYVGTLDAVGKTIKQEQGQ